MLLLLLDVKDTVIHSFMKGRRRVIKLPLLMNTKLSAEIEEIEQKKKTAIEV